MLYIYTGNCEICDFNLCIFPCAGTSLFILFLFSFIARFSDEGTAKNLEYKINIYLQINLTKFDPLPKGKFTNKFFRKLLHSSHRRKKMWWIYQLVTFSRIQNFDSLHTQVWLIKSEVFKWILENWVNATFQQTNPEEYVKNTNTRTASMALNRRETDILFW